jgi:hypothetical protein
MGCVSITLTITILIPTTTHILATSYGSVDTQRRYFLIVTTIAITSTLHINVASIITTIILRLTIVNTIPITIIIIAHAAAITIIITVNTTSNSPPTSLS